MILHAHGLSFIGEINEQLQSGLLLGQLNGICSFLNVTDITCAKNRKNLILIIKYKGAVHARISDLIPGMCFMGRTSRAEI